jgi:hypothetical protein
MRQIRPSVPKVNAVATVFGLFEGCYIKHNVKNMKTFPMLIDDRIERGDCEIAVNQLRLKEHS